MQASPVERRYDGNVPSFGEGGRRSFCRAAAEDGDCAMAGPDARGVPRQAVHGSARMRWRCWTRFGQIQRAGRALLQRFPEMFPMLCSTSEVK